MRRDDRSTAQAPAVPLRGLSAPAPPLRRCSPQRLLQRHKVRHRPGAARPRLRLHRQQDTRDRRHCLQDLRRRTHRLPARGPRVHREFTLYDVRRAPGLGPPFPVTDLHAGESPGDCRSCLPVSPACAVPSRHDGIALAPTALPTRPYIVDSVAARCLETILVLHMDHEQNVRRDDDAMIHALRRRSGCPPALL